ncbi:MAG: hypothetical protein ACRC10_12270 [Thermoguttaceae bacterium]
MNNEHIIEGFSTVRMKRELQEKFQRKTAGMCFKELRWFLDKTLEPLPKKKQDAPYEVSKNDE